MDLFAAAYRTVYDGANLDRVRRDLAREHPGFSEESYSSVIYMALQFSRH